VPDIPNSPILASSGPTWLYLTWDTPDTHGGFIYLYTIQVFNDAATSSLAQSVTSEDTNVNITGLAAFTGYWIEIAATNFMGASNYSEPISFNSFSSL
jgi:hypothetical protein